MPQKDFEAFNRFLIQLQNRNRTQIKEVLAHEKLEIEVTRTIKVNRDIENWI